MKTGDVRLAPAGWKRALVAFVALASLAVTVAVKPLPQDPRYHVFADQRSFLGVPHMMDVASNLPFLVVGLVGLCNVLLKKDLLYPSPEARPAWILLGLSIFLTGLGSAYYHWAPSDARLFWDRLPMALGFSALLGIMILERVDRPLGRLLWAPGLVAGVASLLYWRCCGDLRFYFLLQAWAVLLVPLILLLFAPPCRGTGWLALGIGVYAVSKVFELLDRRLYQATGLVSGHTLKHLSAALGSGLLLVHVIKRRPL